MHVEVPGGRGQEEDKADGGRGPVVLMRTSVLWSPSLVGRVSGVRSAHVVGRVIPESIREGYAESMP